MKLFKKSILGTTVLALGLSAFGVTGANAGASGNSAYVHDVHLSFPGFAAVITVRNTSANKHVNAVNLQVQETHADFLLSGSVICESNNKIHFEDAAAYFGPVGMGGLDNVNASSALYTESNFSVASYKLSDNVAPEYSEEIFSVPLNAIANGHPAIRMNPLEEVEKMLQAHINNGGTEAEFYQQQHEVVLQRAISLSGTCQKDGLSKSGFQTENHAIQVRYLADPQVHDNPVLNAQLGGNLPQQFGGAYQPLMITDAFFQPNMPHHVGPCPLGTQVRFTYSGHGEGEVMFRVLDDGQTIYQSVAKPYNQDLNEEHFYFYMMAPQTPVWDLNETVNHNLTLHVKTKDANADVWESHYQLVDQSVWKHRCTPSLNAQIGGNGGILSPDNAGPDNAPARLGRLSAPVDPRPSRRFRARP